MRTSAKRGGYAAEFQTTYINTTDKCVELFFWPVAGKNSIHRPIISVLTVTEARTQSEWVRSTGYELETWNRLFAKLPKGIHRLVIRATRSSSGINGMSIDDIVLQPCVKFGNTWISLNMRNSIQDTVLYFVNADPLGICCRETCKSAAPFPILVAESWMPSAICTYLTTTQSGAFLAAAVWGGQRGNHIYVWGQEFRMT